MPAITATIDDVEVLKEGESGSGRSWVLYAVHAGGMKLTTFDGKWAGLVGQTVEILVEGTSLKNEARLFGRTRTNIGVVFEGADRHKGMVMPVRVERATVVTLYATPAILNL